MRRTRIGLVFFATLIAALPHVATAQYGYHFGRNKIQYDDFDWRVLKTEHFDIYYYPEMADLAQQGAHFAEEVYAELQNRFAFALNNRVPLIFYSSNLHFKQTNVTPGFIPDGVGGFFEFLKGRVVIPANGNIQRFRRVIRHELVHVFTYNRLSRALRDRRMPVDRMFPLWFTEGLAEYWSGGQDHQHEMVIRDALASNRLVPMESIEAISGTFVMYKQGESICRYIAETWGEEKLLQLIDSSWKHRDFRVVIESELGMEFGEVAAGWETWLRARYYPDFDSLQVPSLETDAISAGGFSAKPAFYRFADGRRAVFFVGNRDGFSNLFQVEVDSTYRPVSRARILLEGERNDRYEAFHLFESRISVSRDGRLAFVTKYGAQDVVHVYDIEADRPEAVLRFDRLVAVYSPSWSPDGRRLVFTAIDASGYSDLFTYDLDSAELYPLTHDAYDDQDPAWSPDGRRISFVSDRTADGANGAYNLFLYALDDGTITHVTTGDRMDFAPSWSPDGNRILFTSAIRDSTGTFAAQDLWEVDVAGPPGLTNTLRRLSRFPGATYDPVWTDDDRAVFTAFEGMSFSIRSLDSLSRRVEQPLESRTVDLTRVSSPWEWPRRSAGDGLKGTPYTRRFQLDLAQGLVSQNPVIGTTGGAVIGFSDMLGDDYLYLTLFNSAETQRELLRSLSFQAVRYHMGRRTNFGYGIFRYGGLRYDITDPDAPAGFPRFYEDVYGGFGVISHPISKFRRVELETSLSWSSKEISSRNIDRDALLLSNSVSLVHDNALYWYNGPIAGWRSRLLAAYTTDIRYSNVSYFSLMADARHYLRIAGPITLASWGLVRMNHGREARLWVTGGSWDLRGFRLFSVRGQKMWFTSHELRFPILENPSVAFPILAPFGVVNLRGALFFDAAHAWNDEYDDQRKEINSGETVGAVGYGVRLNLFGGLILRWDRGWRFRDGFTRHDKWFKQFFFGWDF